MNPEALDQLARLVAEALKPALRENIREILREELHSCTPKLSAKELADDGFFRRLNEEIMGRLGDIYREISSFQGPPSGRGTPEDALQAGELMDEASHRLDQVIQATEKATFEIIELVERSMSVPDEILHLFRSSVCDGHVQEQAQALCQRLSQDMVQIMTCLSFQDLTGQRIKRVIDMLGRVRDMVAELYVSTGLLVKAQEMDPGQPLEELKRDAKAKVSQSDVDDLLAQLNT
ncbi:hypothetical protein NNJEOMEG_00775 [Fundidesulfovibrio magnetotacticus]|uniref:Chemotaxis protein CheZ n=1 Tax=Fundidesulfovibrio magnetotacticus TaxID=2730080 RepID=A0A6V8LTI2_9BACT|nr:protein phosphatase CheZ [Fundidesulfovibrio magnetotacticus]GFK92947.1 hypothetical protein NNJEOMEG_00775 [Fundidesulfovibrio magnetotacticus]